MTRSRIKIIIGAAVAAAGLGAAAAITACATSSPAAPSVTTLPGTSASSWYQSMMSRYYGASTMMGEDEWMISGKGYRWMTGGRLTAPSWMRGDRLPTAMMGTTTDMGEIMGRLWANSPGPRVSSQQAARDGRQIPTGAAVNQTANTITFTSTAVNMAAEASPPGGGGSGETFRIAGLVNPKIIVPVGAVVTILLINADANTAHGLVITASRPASWMPMMTGRPAFPGAALWFLGTPAIAGMHSGTLTFTAAAAGIYEYLCPVPGHAQRGMVGSFVVTDLG